MLFIYVFIFIYLNIIIIDTRSINGAEFECAPPPPPPRREKSSRCSVGNFFSFSFFPDGWMDKSRASVMAPAQLVCSSFSGSPFFFALILFFVFGFVWFIFDALRYLFRFFFFSHLWRHWPLGSTGVVLAPRYSELSDLMEMGVTVKPSSRRDSRMHPERLKEFGCVIAHWKIAPGPSCFPPRHSYSNWFRSPLSSFVNLSKRMMRFLKSQLSFSEMGEIALVFPRKLLGGGGEQLYRSGLRISGRETELHPPMMLPGRERRPHVFPLFLLFIASGRLDHARVSQ